MAKKEKELKGFVDYTGQILSVLPSKLPSVTELMRRAIIAAGAPDFGDLMLGKMMVANKEGVQCAFVEVAQIVPADRTPDWITFSIPMVQLGQILPQGNYYLEGEATCRHYRQAKRYLITHLKRPVRHFEAS